MKYLLFIFVCISSFVIGFSLKSYQPQKTVPLFFYDQKQSELFRFDNGKFFKDKLEMTETDVNKNMGVWMKNYCAVYFKELRKLQSKKKPKK